MPDIMLSVIFGTYNRQRFLIRCLNSVRHAVGNLSHEIIIIDGGSTDGSLSWLRFQPDVTLIEHGELRGPVAAYNDGFRQASGKYVAYLNDDLVLELGTLSAAVAMLEADDKLGVVSIPYRNPGTQVVSLPLATINGKKKYPFASFGVVRRDLGEKAGWFTDKFYHYYGDIALCVNIQRMGYKIQALPVQLACTHYCADNTMRGVNRWSDPNTSAKQDDAAFNLYWKGRLKPNG